MTSQEFVTIAKLYGYIVDPCTIEGIIFDDKEVPIDKSKIEYPLPKEILGLSAEIENSENIFGVYLDSNNKTLSGIIAIQFINLTDNSEIFFNLDNLKEVY